jgi:hypothetical protein
LSDFVWIGLRDQQLFGYTRSGWQQTLAQPGTGALVLAGPHALTPAELMPALDRGNVPGAVLARQLATAGEWASIYAVAPESIRAEPAAVALHMSPAAGIAWLDLAAGAGASDAAQRLVAVAPVVVGNDTGVLVRRLADVACLVADPADGPESSRVVTKGSECSSGG